MRRPDGVIALVTGAAAVAAGSALMLKNDQEEPGEWWQVVPSAWDLGLLMTITGALAMGAGTEVLVREEPVQRTASSEAPWPLSLRRQASANR